MIERLGIVEEMKPKSKYPVPGTLTADMLVRGEVDLAVQQIPELVAVDGVELVGPLPGDLQTITVYAGGITTTAREPSAAQEFLAFLRSPRRLRSSSRKAFLNSTDRKQVFASAQKSASPRSIGRVMQLPHLLLEC